MSNPQVMAYRRENGRVGIRNHVIILPLDDLSNAACEKVAFNIKGCKALPHAYGRLQFGEDLQLFFRTLIGTGANPLLTETTPGLETNKWVYIQVDEGLHTTKPGVFAGGDIVRGGATVILAMGDGRTAAASINKWLDTGDWPTPTEMKSR